MKNKHEMWELKQKQSLPLEAKIQMTRRRIQEWVDEFGVDGVYISFSGGKDSTVLLDIARKDYPQIDAFFVNTGLEYPSVRRFALSKENVYELKPSMNFREVLIKYGYPIISKEVSRNVGDVQKLGKECFAYRMFDGSIKGSVFDKSGYSFLLKAPFKISSRCCDVMKKNPLHRVSRYAKPITAQMASESRQRLSQWIQNGCNAFNLKNPISNPMSFWTEQDVLTYIHNNKLDIAEAYGLVVRDWDKDGLTEGQIDFYEEFSKIVLNPNSVLPNYSYKTTGCQRTGCIFCGFGIIKDKRRFTKLSKEEPKLCDYVMRGGEFDYKAFNRKGTEINLKHCTKEQIKKWCVDNADNKNFKIESIWKPSKKGLGYWFVLEWLNTHGNLDIEIPNRKYYLQKYGSDRTEEFLK